MSDDLYHELILDLNRHPLNKGVLDNFDAHLKTNNPACGDNLSIFIKWNKSKRISSIFWNGEGCALSRASASLFTEHLKGMNKTQISKFKPAQLLKILKINKLNPSRMKCLLLPFEAIKKL